MKKNIIAFCISLVAFFIALDASSQGLIRRNTTGLPVRTGTTPAAAATASAAEIKIN